jgi:exopolyphosphatase/guanosine-5'-triphosphate,3'-diphosphate pyrophosphatase
MKFAAIDIGSNAVRLLFMQVFEYGVETVFKKDALFRVPVRLGEDVFVTREISSEKADSLINTFNI